MISSSNGSTFEFTTGFTAASYRYHRLNFDGNGSNGFSIAEIEWWEKK